MHLMRTNKKNENAGDHRTPQDIITLFLSDKGFDLFHCVVVSCRYKHSACV